MVQNEGDEKMSVLTITKENYESEVLQSDKPVLLEDRKSVV